MQQSLTIFLLGITYLLNGQSFTLTTSNAQPRKGERFTVTYTLENATPQQFLPPDFGKSFTVVSGPNRGSRVSIVNGRKSSSISYSYQVAANRIGRINLPSAAVLVNGRRMTASGKTINVREPGEELQIPETQNALVLEVNADTAYVGQQLHLDFVLYTTATRIGFDFTKLPSIDGAYEQALERFDDTVRPDTIDGTVYSRKVLRRVAVFPQQAGTMEIGVGALRLTQETGRTIRRGFFPERETIASILQTEATTIPVLALPQPTPNNFSGAVESNLQMQIQLDKWTLTTDGALKLTLTLFGESDVKRWAVPEIEFGAEFEVYEPTVLGQQTQESGGVLKSRKQIQYTLLPRRAGTYTLRPSISYFAPDTAAYLTAQSRSFRVVVDPGKAIISEDNPIENATPSGPAPYFTTTSLVARRQSYYGSVLFWLLTSFPIVGLLGVMFYKNRRDNRTERDPSLVKRERARAEAERHLSTAKSYLASENFRAFYQEIHRATLGYVADKLSLKNTQLNTSNLINLLKEREVPTELIQDFEKTLKQTETARFAGTTAIEKTPEEFYRTIRELLLELDAKLNKTT